MKGKKSIIITLIVLLVLILSAIGGYFGYKAIQDNKSVGTDWGDIYYKYLQETFRKIHLKTLKMEK